MDGLKFGKMIFELVNDIGIKCELAVVKDGQLNHVVLNCGESVVYCSKQLFLSHQNMWSKKGFVANICYLLLSFDLTFGSLTNPCNYPFSVHYSSDSLELTANKEVIRISDIVETNDNSTNKWNHFLIIQQFWVLMLSVFVSCIVCFSLRSIMISIMALFTFLSLTLVFQIVLCTKRKKLVKTIASIPKRKTGV